MGATLDEIDMAKIQAARILGIKYLDDIDDIPKEVVDYVNNVNWNANKEELQNIFNFDEEK